MLLKIKNIDMLLILFLRVGTIVPLALGAVALVLIFFVFYWKEYKRFRLLKNTFAGSASFAYICEGYINANVENQRINKNRYLFWLFGSKYNDLLSSYLQRTIYELDRFEQFREEGKGLIISGRHSFDSQWKILRGQIFKPASSPENYELRDGFWCQPFGSLYTLIANKIFALYKKDALLILRTKGYWEFCEFLVETTKESERYSPLVPFCGNYIVDMNICIVSDYQQEVIERIRHEWNKIGTTSPHRLSDLSKLLESYVLKDEKFLKSGSDLYHLKNEIKTESQNVK